MLYCISVLGAFTKLQEVTVSLIMSVVCFLLGNSPASEFYMPMFRNTLSVPSSYADRYEVWLDLRNVGVFIREKVWLENILS